MNIEIIKIKPPIVVKEELEVENNKHFEVQLPQRVADIMSEDENYEIKLEDEEKPEPVKEFILIENKPSRSGTVELDEASYLVMKEVDFCEYNKFEVKLENEEKPHVLDEFTSEENEELTSEVEKMNDSDSDRSLLTCSHCGEERTSKEMVQTPETEDELMKWCNVLGEEFSETFTIRSPVCRNHFIDEFGDSRLVDIFRKNGRIETKLGDRLRCCYCGESRMSRSTTKVPTDEFYFSKWCEILGKDFEEYCKRNRYGSICRTHFNTEWKKQRPKNLLPVADKKKFEQNVITVPEETITEAKIAEKKNVCAYCGESKISKDMTKVPPNPNILKKWSDILGEEFHRKTLSKKLLYICRSHFKVKWERTRPHYVLPFVEPVQLVLNVVKDEEYSELESSNLLMEDPIPVQRKKRKFNRNDFQETNLGTCCCCGAEKDLVELVKTPATVGELLEWYRILGENFYKNSQNPKSSMVCRSHFDDEKMKKKPGELSRISFLNEKPRLYNVTGIVRQDEKVEKKNPSSILCAYCGVRKPIRIMTTIPYDPNTLRQWGQILGEDFYRNALADRYSSICRSHFNVEWIHIRPRNLLPRANSACVPSDQVIRDNSTMRNVKLEEPEMYEDSEKKPPRLSDQSIKPEARSQEFARSEKTVNEKTHSDNQYESSDPKRIKLEIKEEENMD